MSGIPGIIITPPPVRPEATDNGRYARVNERQGGERRAAGPKLDFAASQLAGDAQPQNQTPTHVQTREAAADASAMLARRRTDSGKPGEVPAGIEIPTHLERRRAWREAKGLNTFHTQNLAQAEETAPDRETRNAATQAYRARSGRGILDIDLAQRLSLTV